MTISFEIPQDIEQELSESVADLNGQAREAFLVDLFREHKISHRQLGEALGLEAYETDGLLKKHGVCLGISIEELRAEAAALSDVRPE